MSGKDGMDHRLERLIFFSDAVIAIAITLLIIEIHPPHLHAGEDGWAALGALFPEFFGFFLSFAVIGRFWMGHHSALSAMTAYEPRLLFPNLAFLMAIVFMPFSTGFLSANLGEFVPALFYNLTLTMLAALNAWVIFIATGCGHVTGTPHTPEMRIIRSRALAVLVGSLLSVALAFLVPGLSQLALLPISLYRRLIVRMRKVAT